MSQVRSENPYSAGKGQDHGALSQMQHGIYETELTAARAADRGKK
jgi:hypothetical protein